MKTIALISQKGGVGKTTLAIGLAVAAQKDGYSAAILDLDPQASAAFWHDTRNNETPAVVAVPASRLKHMLDAARESGCTFAVIDTPPFAKDIAFEAVQHADAVLIPTRPAVLDVMAMVKTFEVVRHYQKPATVVLTLCPPKGREIVDTIDTIRSLGADLAAPHIHNRIAYSRAQQTGRSVQEFEPNGKAAYEIRQLYVYTRDHLFSAKE